jgi:hypothetical protein
MPEPTDEELGIPEGLDPNIRAELRKSRQRSQEAEAAKAEAQAAKVELEFYKAGIPDNPVANMFRKAYDGPIEVAAIKEAYATLTGEGAPVPSAADVEHVLQVERERLAQMQRGTEGGRVLPRPDAQVEFTKAMRSAQTEAEAWAVIEKLGPAAGVRRYIQGD